MLAIFSPRLCTSIDLLFTKLICTKLQKRLTPEKLSHCIPICKFRSLMRATLKFSPPPKKKWFKAEDAKLKKHIESFAILLLFEVGITMILPELKYFYSEQTLWQVSTLFCGFLLNWDSIYARLNSHYKAWSYKRKKHKKIKTYRKSV